MKLHWRMPDSVRTHFQAELRWSLQARRKEDLGKEWLHLERAHILAQRWPREHLAVHGSMLLFGIRMKDAREIIGQLPRLFFGGVKSFVGTVPIGNTGGADVPALRTLTLPADLALVLEGH